MANETVDLRSEERRRQITLMLLGGLLFVTTVPVVNQRALFSPLGDVPILGDLSPVAYAATFGTPLTPGIPGGAGGTPVSGGGEVPPGAYGARTPGEPGFRAPPTGGTYSPPPPGVVGNPPTFSSPPGTPPGGNGVPGGGGGLPGGGGGLPGGGGGLPGGGGGTPGGGGTTPGVVGAVPEPATWLTMILGFAIVGGIMRRARQQEAARRHADPLTPARMVQVVRSSAKADAICRESNGIELSQHILTKQ
jgi:hypothetical protein